MIFLLSSKYIHSDNPSFKDILATASSVSPFVLLNTINKLNNLPYARELNNQFTIKHIFRTYWKDFLKAHPNLSLRPSIIKNVEALIDCGSFHRGALLFDCPNCNNFHYQGLSCKSRFCPSCSKKYRDARALEMMNKIIDAPHRHITFTIPDSLRKFFRLDRSLLDSLFLAVNNCLKFLTTGKSKLALKSGRSLGFISTLHSFGRDMKWHPHIHVLVAEKTIDNFGTHKKFSYFNFVSLKKGFMFQLFSLISKKLKNSPYNQEFSLLKNRLYKTLDNGFYVNAPQKKNLSSNDTKLLIEYIVRYSSHPAISESNILNIDFKNHLITYSYTPHEDSLNDKIGPQIVTEHVFDFIKKLIIHIPDKGFQLIRYYGFYSNKSNLKNYITKKIFKKPDSSKIKSLQNWRKRLINTFHYDPILCHCGYLMNFNRKHSIFPKGG